MRPDMPGPGVALCCCRAPRDHVMRDRSAVVFPRRYAMSHDSTTRWGAAIGGALVVAVLVAVPATAADAATLCVNPAGSNGCKTTISAAVAAAAAGDVIRIGKGVYHETVTVTKPLSLIGEGPEQSIIDATHLLNGVNVDGFNHAGLAHVIVTGLTVRNANAQGILVTNATDVAVTNNNVT